ncbi:hypothetical protein G6F56_010429 [Rhizopus delemar]|nr:hypothetical protein G6F56_010429 [Rhizopus delemar]
MDSVQGFGHYEDPFLYNKNETWTNQAQQKEVERLLQLQQLAILQRERASMYQQMLYQQEQYCMPQVEVSPENFFIENVDLYQNYMLPNEHISYMDHVPNKVEKAQKRAEHNAIERARRESLNTKLQQLALSLPNIQDERRPSKGTIIERTLEYIKQTVQKEEDFKYQIDELRKANHELYTQMIIEGEFEDDDEPISETPEETYTCRSSVNSSPVLFNYPLMASYEKTGQVDLLMTQGRDQYFV